MSEQIDPSAAPPDPWKDYHDERCDFAWFGPPRACSCGLADLIATERQHRAEVVKALERELYEARRIVRQYDADDQSDLWRRAYEVSEDSNVRLRLDLTAARAEIARLTEKLAK